MTKKKEAEIMLEPTVQVDMRLGKDDITAIVVSKEEERLEKAIEKAEADLNAARKVANESDDSFKKLVDKLTVFSKEDMALPIIAPWARSRSATLMAWPSVFDVVSRSPGLMAPPASASQ